MRRPLYTNGLSAAGISFQVEFYLGFTTPMVEKGWRAGALCGIWERELLSLLIFPYPNANNRGFTKAFSLYCVRPYFPEAVPLSWQAAFPLYVFPAEQATSKRTGAAPSSAGLTFSFGISGSV